MCISRRFLKLIKDSSTKGLVFNSAKAPSRKLSAVGSGGSESFPNLIVSHTGAGATSLRGVDLRAQLFNTSTSASTFGELLDISFHPDHVQPKLALVAELKMDWFPLPPPIFSILSTCWVDDVLPLSDGKILINHPSGGLLFDVNTYNAVPMLNLHRRSSRGQGDLISLFVPNADDLAGGGNLYIMERIPKPDCRWGSTLSYQFQALVYRRPTMTSSSHLADCRLLPPPPFISDPDHRITTYAAVGSNIYISVECAGTYCFDTLSNTWDRVGQWTLPFRGKLEYVPDLKLWFGLSAEHGHLAAADLSDMNSQPQLADTEGWKELELPCDWLDVCKSQLVNLGSGRFCIARFLCSVLMEGDSTAEINKILVLTGVEVTSPVRDCNSSGSSTREVKLAIQQHKSKCLMSERATITFVV